MPQTALEHVGNYWVGRFQAMASPCELLMDIDDHALAEQLLQIASTEAWRIEANFSRYRDDNLIHCINHARGQPVAVDEELAALLDYADQCYRISDGMFDITSGILRTVWKFDGSDRIPSQADIAALLPRIGWDKVTWQRPHFTLPAGMEIDLGGIGKEYAVDRTAQLLAQQTPASLLINYGGDLYVTGPRRDHSLWSVGVEDPDQIHGNAPASRSLHQLQISKGGMATSGDARRYLLKDGIRYSHILDPRSGWPVRDAPHSVTVAAASCTEAGILATLAMLHGAQAEEFLELQQVQYWCAR